MEVKTPKPHFCERIRKKLIDGLVMS